MSDFDAEAMVDAMAPFLGLTVEDEYRAGIVQHLNAAWIIAQSVLGVELKDDAEPAPVYRP